MGNKEKFKTHKIKKKKQNQTTKEPHKNVKAKLEEKSNYLHNLAILFSIFLYFAHCFLLLRLLLHKNGNKSFIH